MDQPLFTIVIPSFNQGPFLRDALESVASYPEDFCEVIVMDGGSDDGSVEIIKEFASRLAHWQSEPDGGQSAALHAGFRMARGSILGWVNSDDRLTPNALFSVADFFSRNPSVNWAAGDHNFIDGDGAIILTRYMAPVSYQELYWGHRYLPQEAVFYRRDFYFRAGEINPDLPLTMDYDLWLRFGILERPAKMPAVLGEFRRHNDQKTWSLSNYHRAAEENRKLHQAPPKPGVLRRIFWWTKHRSYTFVRGCKDRGVFNTVRDMPKRAFAKVFGSRESFKDEDDRAPLARLEGALVLLGIMAVAGGVFYLLFGP